jgi:ribokinase
MNTEPLNFNPASLKFKGIVGTGGIGAGKFFVLNGDHTLGREESRSGHFLDVNDYCKQHIILHYVKTLLGPSFAVIPIGQVGNDDTGGKLIREMQETGFEMDYVHKSNDFQTLFSFCFSYPDGSGGNLTTDNSASSNVDTALIERARETVMNLGPSGIIMAAPEVPFEARARLIEIGNEYGSYCTASFTSEEMHQAADSGLISRLDLLAVNIDEAGAIIRKDTAGTRNIVKEAISKLTLHNNRLKVSITLGKEGSCCWDGTDLRFFPAVLTQPISTAGAGDAFFSGLLCGVALGFNLFEAQELATLVAGLSVQSPHTIHKGIDRNSLFAFCKTNKIIFSENIINLIEK